MKKLALMTAISALFLSAPTYANEEGADTSGMDIAGGFLAWKKDVQRYGGKGGEELAHEVDAWIKDLKRISH